MEILSCDMHGKDVSVYFLTDCHVGNSNFAEKQLKQTVREIDGARKKHDDIMVILGGDMIEAIVINDKRFSPSEIDPDYKIKFLKDLPRIQMKHFYGIIKPIEDLIKFALIGNHEESYIKQGHFDVYDYLCSDLLPNCRKVGFLGYVQVYIHCSKTHKRKFNLCLTHGTGGNGFTAGYPLTNCLEIFKKYRADCYLMGHVHRLYTQHKDYVSVNSNGTLCYDREWYGIGGSYLETLKPGFRNYFEGKKGDLSDIGYLEFNLINKQNIKNDIYEKLLIQHLF